MPTYRFRTTVTRIAEYVTEAVLPDDEAAEEYAGELNPDEMEELDDYTNDVSTTIRRLP